MARASDEPAGAPAPAIPRLDLLKALGDNTRYAIYLELARSATPLATVDVAETLNLHPNTVRPHLERMREVGLLEVSSGARTGVGRPQNLYALSDGAPSLGLEPPTFPMLARMLVRLAEVAGATADDAVEAGREQGQVDAAPYASAASCLEALVDRLDGLGFDPAVDGSEEGETAVIAFAHCPFRELAEAHPELVCSLHRGLVEGFVDAMGDAEVHDFHPLVHRLPCQVSLSVR
jgi:predicted ArsR family transcriptional regulator